MTHRRFRAPSLHAATAVLLLLGATALAADDDRWFHVHVTEGDEGASVRVNLPLTLIEKAVDMIPDTASEEVRVELNEAGFDIDELRSMWDEIRTSPDATYVTVENDEQTVKVRKEGQYLIARTVERRDSGAKVDVRFPLEVVDALFSGEGQSLDLAAALRALASYEGDMVTVEAESTRVRIWVDDRNESE